MWLSQHFWYQTSSLWNGALPNIHHIFPENIKWMEIIQVDTPMGNYNLKVMCLLTCAGQGDFNSIFCRGVSMDSGSFDSPSRGMIYARKGIIRWLEISEQFAWKSLVNERLSYKLRFAPVLVWYHLFLYYPSIYNEDFMFFDTSMVLHGILFLIPFGSILCKNPHTYAKSP